jgi:EAL domain-containing protein (putative c-di-GMP-specific phosphodiesterase class I)
LHQYPIDVLKIDRSFVSGEAPNGEAIIEAIVMMSQALGIRVIAEGIETTTQLSMLNRIKCEYGQGYLFGMPEPEDTIIESKYFISPKVVNKQLRERNALVTRQAAQRVSPY